MSRQGDQPTDRPIAEQESCWQAKRNANVLSENWKFYCVDDQPPIKSSSSPPIRENCCGECTWLLEYLWEDFSSKRNLVNNNNEKPVEEQIVWERRAFRFPDKIRHANVNRGLLGRVSHRNDKW